MTLEPTDEQLTLLASEQMCCHPSSSTCTCQFRTAAKAQFALVRDMVLEAAKHECEAVMERFNASAAELRVRSAGANGAANCAAAIHAMKGKP